MRDRRARGATAILIAWALAARSLPVRADAGADAEKQAQVLFVEGMKLLAAKQYAEACDKLARSQELDPGMGTQFRLAECYEKLGRPASAYAEYLAVADAANAAGKRDREVVARKRASVLEAKVARLTILVPPAVAALPGVELTRDGVKLPAKAWGLPAPVEPGDHVVTVTANKKKPWTSTMFTEAGAKFTMAVGTPDDLVRGPGPPPPPPRSIIPAIALGVLGGAGLVVGGTFIGLRQSKISSAHTLSADITSMQGNCLNGGMARYAADCKLLASKAAAGDTLGTVSIVGWTVGGAALAAMAAYLLWPRPAPPVVGGLRVDITPAIGAREGGLAAQGSF